MNSDCAAVRAVRNALRLAAGVLTGMLTGVVTHDVAHPPAPGAARDEGLGLQALLHHLGCLLPRLLGGSLPERGVGLGAVGAGRPTPWAELGGVDLGYCRRFGHGLR